MTKPDTYRQLFELFNEIGIINQLAVTVFNRQMPDNLHVSHFSVLNHLIRLGDGKTPKAITSAFQVTKGTMTNTLNDLSGRGLIEMKPHDTDRRSKLVFLTEEGRLFQQQAMASLVPYIAALDQHLDVDETLATLPALKRLRETLDNMRDETI